MYSLNISKAQLDNFPLPLSDWKSVGGASELSWSSKSCLWPPVKYAAVTGQSYFQGLLNATDSTAGRRQPPNIEQLDGNVIFCGFLCQGHTGTYVFQEILKHTHAHEHAVLNPTSFWLNLMDFIMVNFMRILCNREKKLLLLDNVIY